MRDAFSSAAYFAKSLVTQPKETLKSTMEGIRHFGDMPLSEKIFTPLFAASGAFVMAAGAAAGDPLAVSLGTINVGVAAGWLCENGENATVKAEAPKPPGPPPAV